MSILFKYAYTIFSFPRSGVSKKRDIASFQKKQSTSSLWIDCAKQSKIALACMTLFLLTGCSIFGDDETRKTEPTDNNAWIAHTKKVESLLIYSTKGNFAYISTDNRQSASFFWEQKDDQNFRLLLLNPLGKTVVSMNVTAEMTEIIDDKGASHRFDDPQVAIYELARMEIPINNLRLWMLGLPGNAESLTFNTNNLLESAVYEDTANNTTWQISYLKYDMDMSPPLPSNIEVKSGSENGVRIKLKINDWNL